MTNYGNSLLENTIKAFYQNKGYELLEPAPLINQVFPNTFNPSAGHTRLIETLEQKPLLCLPNKFLSIEQCFRHIDIDKLGYANHLSLFEMASAFSIEEATSDQKSKIIEDAFNFLTKTLSVDRRALFVTVFGGGEIGGIHMEPDTVTRETWEKMGIHKDNIIEFGPNHNFLYPAVEDDVAGPKCEIFFDFGERMQSWGRFVEIVNMEFLPYITRSKKGRMQIDEMDCLVFGTSFGIERLSMIMEGKSSVYDISLFAPLRTIIESHINDTSKRHFLRYDINLLLDLMRAMVLIVHHGQKTDNTSRGEILKKIIKKVNSSMIALEIANVSFVEDIIQSVADLYRVQSPNIMTVTDTVRELIEARKKIWQKG